MHNRAPYSLDDDGSVKPVSAANPWLASLLLRQQSSIISRFAYYHRRLSELPRRVRRSLHRRLALTVTGAALLLALSQVPAPAMTTSIAVDNGAVVVADDGKCSLGEAIINANDTVDGSVHSDCAAGDPSGADTIVLPTNGRFNMSINQSALDGDYNALPPITSVVTIQGNNSTFLRNPAGIPLRFIGVFSSAELTVDAITFEGGLSANYAGGAIRSEGSLLTISNCVFRANKGSAIKVSGHRVTITDSTFENNEGIFGGAIYSMTDNFKMTGSLVTGNTAVKGGGGVIAYSGGVVIEDTVFQNNKTSFEGGAALELNNTSRTLVVDSQFLDNESAGTGGAISSHVYSDLIIRGTTISNNRANFGGGISSLTGTLVIEQSAVSGNRATWGGGIAVTNSSATIDNSTISGNWVYEDGGGVLAQNSPVTLTNVTLTDNTATNAGGGLWIDAGSMYGEGDLTAERTLVTGNDAPTGAQIWAMHSGLATDGFNLFGADGDAGIVGFTPGPSDIVPPGGVTTLQILNPSLADNGGLTLTHALVPGSPAIDAAPSADCAGQSDQRGQPRNQDGDGAPSDSECDIGAFERQPGGTSDRKFFLPFTIR